MAERYRWVSGPNNGKVDVVNCEDDNFIYFQSGRKAPKNNLNAFVFQIDDAQETHFSNSLNTFEDEINSGGFDYVDDGTLPTTTEGGSVVEKPQPQQPQVTNTQNNHIIEKPQPKVIESPIMNLLKIQKEETLQDVSCNVTINLKFPRNDFVNILYMTFGEDESKKEILNYIEQQITPETLVNGVETTIKNMLNEL